jgi:Ser-tRNA(Ala) deacylase AlaX
MNGRPWKLLNEHESSGALQGDSYGHIGWTSREAHDQLHAMVRVLEHVAYSDRYAVAHHA